MTILSSIIVKVPSSNGGAMVGAGGGTTTVPGVRPIDKAISVMVEEMSSTNGNSLKFSVLT